MLPTRPPCRVSLALALALAGIPGLAAPLPAALQGATNRAALGPKQAFALNDAQLAALAKNGFVIVPAAWREFHQLYEDTRYAYQPVFVTTDSALHVYHLAYDKLLRDLEREQLAPAVTKLTASLLMAAQRQAVAARGTPLEGSARRTLAYLAVAARLADPRVPVPASVAGVVAQELALIGAHGGPAPSPLLAGSDPRAPYVEDYGQYLPRGHYAGSEALRRYFRAMTWLGHMNLRLHSDEETHMALLTTRLLRQTPGATDLWARVYDSTALLVGASDDLDYRSYGLIAARTFGENLPLGALADPARFAQFRAAARNLPPPQVNSLWLTVRQQKGPDTQGFRLMGQRFTLDAYLMGQLIWREVGNNEFERPLPRALDVLAALGNSEAYNVLSVEGQTKFKNYYAQLAKVRAQVKALDDKAWSQNLYWGWLHVLQAVATSPTGARVPAFMRSPAWARKDLVSALGSYTELKHDTVLYAKQVMAEMGGGGDVELPRSYVEPNALAYARLLALTQQTKRELSARKLLSAASRETLDSLSDMLTFLQKVARAQLAGSKLSQEDYDRLLYYGGWLEQRTLAAADTSGGEGRSVFGEDERAALVTDVASSPRGEVLTEATGPIFELYALVPDGKGGQVVARGGVYSYYEFVADSGERLTDEAWRARVKANQLPPQPAWVRALITK